ncbi:MAG: hypothetical protein KIT60_12015 [Burkholderiaceae bacterium]|nr:hypothetical protein [Burkholderiaceae bacterium]
MPRRQLALLAVLALGFALFVAFAATSEHWSLGDVVGLAAVGIVFVVFAFVLLATRGRQPVDGHRGMPRWYWVLFASFAAAFALSMLLSVLAMPFVGYRGFDLFFGSERWLLLVLAAAVYPFVRKRLQ